MSILHPKLWTPRGQEPPATESAGLAAQLGISEVVAGLLWRRGLRELPEMDIFLSPGLRHLAAPSLFPGLSAAAAIIAEALTSGRRMAVWGDYDVDGVTATAVVKEVLGARGFPVEHHIPVRMREGYGLSTAGIERLASDGVELLLTVDCGITSVAEIERANELGMRVVVSDHHLPGEALPPAAAIVNPRLCACPCESLAGVGVAFLLMAAVNKLLPGDPMDIRRVLDLVALGTLADVVELSGQNRVLVKNGMLFINEGTRPGIFALKEAAGFGPTDPLGAGRVVFGLAPRINAAGRLGEAELALSLLLSPDRLSARPLASRLDTMNAERRREEERITEEALGQAEKQARLPGIVVQGEDWHSGVIGIVASRLVERFNRPALILTREDGKLKGSGRSIEAFDLHRGLQDCSDLLLGFGGHRQAAGLSLAPGKLDELRERFAAAVIAQLGPELPPPRLKHDGELPFTAIDQRLVRELDLLQPFGMGNPEPVFVSGPVELRSRRAFGANHVSLELRESASGLTFRAKAWRKAEEIGQDLVGTTVRVAFTPKIDTWGGLPSIDLTLKDIAPA